MEISGVKEVVDDKESEKAEIQYAGLSALSGMWPSARYLSEVYVVSDLFSHASASWRDSGSDQSQLVITDFGVFLGGKLLRVI